MSGIQRYVPTSSHGGMIRIEVHVESQSDGTYVRYTDHAAEIARLRAEADALRAENASLRSDLTQCYGDAFERSQRDEDDRNRINDCISGY